MITISQKNCCCGCGACSTVCPKHCIDMTPDAEGFEYPLVNRDICVNCHLCEQVCPILQADKQPSGKPYQTQCYAAYSVEEGIRLASSSGGIFSLLAQQVLSQNGVVFGAAFDEQHRVEHVAVYSCEELSALRGSKYVQSRTVSAFRLAKELLSAGRLVLFSGTACQIAGLKGFLRKPYTNLITLDVLCHGVPSPLVWERYLAEQERTAHSPVTDIRFRSKDAGWKTPYVCLTFKDGRVYQKGLSQDSYMHFFLANISLRPSCHECCFKSIPRCSDISLGDAWGIEDYMPELDDNKGTSVVLIHSEVGARIFEQVKPQLQYCPAELDRLLPPHADSRRSVAAHGNRERFFRALRKGWSVSALTKLLRPSLPRRILRQVKKILK